MQLWGTTLTVRCCLSWKTYRRVAKLPLNMRNFQAASCSTSTFCRPFLSSHSTFLYLTSCKIGSFRAQHLPLMSMRMPAYIACKHQCREQGPYLDALEDGRVVRSNQYLVHIIGWQINFCSEGHL